MKSTKAFLEELTSLEGLHLGTVYAYQQARMKLRERIVTGEISDSDPVVATLRGFPTTLTVAPTTQHYRRNLKISYQEQLREIIFVRVISALEEYLINTVRELFIARPDLFQRASEVSISYNQLLSFESTGAIGAYLLNKDTRELHSKGFQAVARYYADRFSIDFSAFDPGLTRLRELHDRRHLLVHRLGRTDPKYRRDYGVEAKQIEVGRTYLADTFVLLREFASFVAKSASKLCKKSGRSRRLPTGRVSIRTKPNHRRGRRMLDPRYTFEHDEQLVLLRDVTIERFTDADGWLMLQLEGDIHVLRNYVGRLQHVHRSGPFGDLEVTVRRLGEGKRRGLFEEFVGRVASEIPLGTGIPQGMKRRLTERYGTSLKRVSMALEEIRLAVEIAEWLRERGWGPGVHRDVALSFQLEDQRAYRILSRIRRGIYRPHVDALLQRGAGGEAEP